MRSFSVDQRRARLGHRHFLAHDAPSLTDLVDAMVVLHATDPATIYLSALARRQDLDIADIGRGLYDERSLVRLLAMRRTLFVVSRAAMPSVEMSSSGDVAANERKRLEKFLADSGVDDPPGWLAAAASEIAAALPPEGATARKLTTLVPRLATKITMGAGTNHEVVAGATSRVLGVLAAEGRLMRGDPGGAWTGRQYVWHTRDAWLGEAGQPDVDPADASTELVTRWLRAFGPAPFDDLKWWTGWTVRKLRPAIEASGAVEVDLDGAVGLALPDDLDDPPPPEPWAALLPSLDPTPMGWKERDWYLDGHDDPLFDRFGNIGPTVWVDGRIVGGWSQRPDGEIVTELLTDVGADHRAMIEARVHRLQAAVGDVVVKPSFPTPLQKQISAG